ncbi:dynamin family protein [Rossellomorea vietnamensis]|uniref:dynamin family protein n=1 Tax=Rossellomorea vietnamensis TaxID=218284 RepID=UPI00077C89D6|nr:dynamin family protein [Rossellomorea vietnamensis]
MNSYETTKDELLSQSKELLEHLKDILPESRTYPILSDFVKDLENDKMMITILGEFKRGKSSLLNAILKQPILPVDVLPATAVVSEIHHGNQGKWKIHKNDGTVEEKDLNRKELEAYTFEGDHDHKLIHRMELALPIPFDNKGTVLVDTPGIGDLNEHQFDVTYSYIPRSDLILFVLNASSPLSKSEFMYLKETVMNLKHGEIAFVLNFKDRVDEDEVEEIEEYVEKKLQKILGQETVSLFMLSAKEAAQGKVDSDFKQLVSFLEERLDKGILAQKKMEFYRKRLQEIYVYVRKEAQEKQHRKEMNEQKIKEEMQGIQEFVQEAKSKKGRMENYIREKEREILLIARKSVRHFEETLLDETFEDISAFHQGDFKGYIEKTVPLNVKRKVQNWVNSYSPNIEYLFEKLENEVSSGMGRLFNQHSEMLNSHFSSFRFQHSKDFVLSNKKVSSNAYFESGLLAGGAAALFLASGAFILLPIISLVGAPFINKLLSDRKLEKAKQAVLPEVDKSIRSTIEKLETGLEEYVHERIQSILNNSQNIFEQTVASYQRELKIELENRKQKLADTTEHPNQLLELIK